MKTAFEGARDIYFVLTCGGSIGNAGAYLKRLSEARGLRFRGCAGAVSYTHLQMKMIVILLRLNYVRNPDCMVWKK